jgi:Rne/Rng family ribonuclease
MAKEMFISSSPHETKVAVLEDDQLVEVYYERDTDVGLVGGIYKGRVNRVLPGMQSAFVDIGLERDAFLYVSDFFFEDQEEYDKVFEEAEARASKYTAETAPVGPGEEATHEALVTPLASVEPVPVPSASEAHPEQAAPSAPPVGQAAAPPKEPRESRRFDPRGRRRRRRGHGGLSERGREHEHKFTPRSEVTPPSSGFEILPGESLAKYSHATPEVPSPAPGSPQEETSAEPVAQSEQDFAPPAQVAALHEPPVAEGLPPEAAPEHTDEPAQPTPEAGPVARSVAIDEAALESAAIEPPVTESLPSPESPLSGSAEEAPEDTSILETAPPEEPLLVEPVVAPEPVEAEVPTEPEQHQPATESPRTSEEPGTDLTSTAPPLAGEAPESESAGEPPAVEEAVPAPAPVEAAEEPAAQPVEVQPTVPETPAGPSERTYTLREPHQRPRFAPRRRRGRRGGGRPRYEGRRESSRPGNNQPLQITELLKEGQEILVQIAKEPLGTKGARITSHIALPGRYLVYMPTIDHIGVSRKISSEEERLRLRNIILENKGPLTGGFIVRTAGEGRSEEEFKADLRFLSTLWNDIRAKAERTKAPAMIHRDLDLVQRLLRDTLTPDFKWVRVDNEVDYERVLDFINRSQPSLIGKVKLYTRHAPLFEEFGVQQEIEKALKPKVWLKSGGYIVINQTEALVAVDVNTGKFVGKTNRLEDTIVKTNIDAVNEIVRQVRLRDLGGIIVIDFIDMDERKNRAKVVQALEEALRRDRAPTKVISFHDFGLVAVTRKRVKQSLERTLCEPCSYCTGSGWVKSVHTVCNEILAEAKKMAREIEGDVLTLRVSPDVAKALKSREGVMISELESLTKKDVIIKSDPTVHQERFEIF